MAAFAEYCDLFGTIFFIINICFLIYIRDKFTTRNEVTFYNIILLFSFIGLMIDLLNSFNLLQKII